MQSRGKDGTPSLSHGGFTYVPANSRISPACNSASLAQNPDSQSTKVYPVTKFSAT